MAASQNLRRELEIIETGIEDLQEALYGVEDDLRAGGVRPGWLRALGVRMLKTDLRRRIRDLRQRRRVVLNCYAEAREYESWLTTTGRQRRREGAAV